eukprot:g2742.t1
MLRDVSADANWSLSSAKPGNGVECLRDDKADSFWQSDGYLPHLINLSFLRKTKISEVHFYLSHKSDESYTPSLVSVRIGNTLDDLEEIQSFELKEPEGWVRLPLVSGLWNGAASAMAAGGGGVTATATSSSTTGAIAGGQGMFGGAGGVEPTSGVNAGMANTSSMAMAGGDMMASQGNTPGAGTQAGVIQQYGGGGGESFFNANEDSLETGMRRGAGVGHALGGGMGATGGSDNTTSPMSRLAELQRAPVEHFVRAFYVQIAILANHQSGRDTHVRQIKVFGPREPDLVCTTGEGENLRGTNLQIMPNSVELLQFATIR